MEWGLVWIISVVVATAIGQKKGEAVSAFFFGLVLGPLGVLIVLLSAGQRKPCPYCRERIDKLAVKCPHCQSNLSGSVTLSSGARDPNKH